MTNFPPPTETIPPIAWRLVAYLRVSTKEQVRHHGLTIQEAECRAAAIETGYRVTRLAQDAQSASDGSVRPGLVHVLDDIKAGRVGGVIVQRLDRIARDVIAQETFILEARRAGGIILSASKAEQHLLGDEPGDPARVMLRQFIGSVAQYEAALTRIRLKAGWEAKKAAGGYVAGRPPIGYRAQSGALVADAREQAVITRALELRGVGHSYREISVMLAGEGRRNRKGTIVWHPETVRRMCQRVMGAELDQPGAWNGYDGGIPDREWATNPGAVQPS